MAVTSFSAVSSTLDVFLRVIPRSACIRHEDRQKEACCCRTGQHTDHTIVSEDEPCHDRSDDREQCRHDHFMETCFRTDIYTCLIVRICLAFHQTFDLSELTAYFYNDTLSRASHGLHGKRREYEGQAGSDEDTDKDRRIHHAHIQCNIRSADFLNLLHIRCNKSKSCQRRRTDGKAFSCGSCCISKRIQRVCTLSYVRLKSCHLRDTARVVSDRSVSVRSQCDTKCGKHSDRCQSDSVQTSCGLNKAAGQRICRHNADRDDDDRHSRGKHTKA